MKIFSAFADWAEKHTVLGGMGYIAVALVIFVVIFLVWGIVDIATHGDPAYDECMAQYNDKEYCMTAPAR